MSLSILPNELLLSIGSELDAKSLNSLLQTSHLFADLLTPTLHKLAASDKDGVPALCWASRKGHVALISLLLGMGTDVNTRDVIADGGHVQGTALHLAPTEAVARLLLENGAKHDIRDHFGCQPLHTAVEKGLNEVVKVLLEYGADIEARAWNVRPPLNVAAQTRGDANILRLLLERGTDAEARFYAGWSAIRIARLVQRNGG